MVTYGFYDSIDHDRKYNAVQFSSMFDGIIKDGVFMSIGDCFRVRPSEGMNVTVGIGRAWFNHTWTLNDSPFPVPIRRADLLLDRIDTIVIDVNSDPTYRENLITVMEGTPSSNPVESTLISTKYHHQYPLAHILVKANATEIREADITNMVGTSITPYVTGILETVNIDALTDQWKDQWDAWYDQMTRDMEAQYKYWETQYSLWEEQLETWTNEYETQMTTWGDNYKSELNTWKTNYQNGLNSFANEYRADMDATADEWKTTWNNWFYTYTNQSQLQFSEWMRTQNAEFLDWFDTLQEVLDGDVAANLTERVVSLESSNTIFANFKNNLASEHTVYDDLYDSGTGHVSEPIVDSSGHIILSRTIFVTK